MRIAVCMSGQLRGWEIAKENQKWFWSSSKEEVDYFIHTWNYSGDRRGVSQPYEWRKVNKHEFNKIVKFYNPKKSIFDKKPQDYFYKNDHWSALFYSFSQSVMMKRQYEIENDFEYDLVIKSRPDVAFPPYSREGIQRVGFTYEPLNDGLVYTTHGGVMEHEFHMFNPNDCVFYSNSYTMDMLVNAYFYRLKVIHEHSGYDKLNFHPLGPGVLMQEYGRDYGLTFIPTHADAMHYQELLIKLGCPEGLDLLKAKPYRKMWKYFRDWYTK
tara:strand:- start:1251 stop:2057 length:807 start_codon:yes stop_codon:yes gene_type:complete